MLDILGKDEETYVQKRKRTSISIKAAVKMSMFTIHEAEEEEDGEES